MVLLCIVCGTLLLSYAAYLSDHKGKNGLSAILAITGIVVAIGGICIFS